MKKKIALLIILLLCLTLLSSGQVADVKLANGSYVLNAPTDRNWVGFNTVPGGFVMRPALDTILIDDSDTQRINYVTLDKGWRISTDNTFGPDESGCNCSWSWGVGDSLYMIFTNANQFQWYGELMEHHGIANVYFGEYLDNPRQLVTTVDTYSPDNLSPTVNWEISELDTNKVYVFSLASTGTKNPLSTGVNIVVQGFKFWKDKDLTPDPIPVEPVPVFSVDIVRQGYYKISSDGVILTGGHAEYDKAVERAVNILLQDSTKKVIILAPSWRVSPQ